MPSQEDRRAELMAGIIDHTTALLQKVGAPTDDAASIAIQLADKILDSWAGQTIVIPMEYHRKLRARDDDMAAQFDGFNYGELASRFGMCERSVRRALARQKARQHKVSKPLSLSTSPKPTAKE